MKRILFLLVVILFSNCKNSYDNTDKVYVEGTELTYIDVINKVNTEIDSVHICTELIDTNFTEDDYAEIALDKYLEMRERGDSVFYDFRSLKDRGPAAAGLRLYFWPNQSYIKVQFLDGNDIVINKVKSIAKKWEEFGNFKFQFGNFSNPDITISFKPNEGSWSYIGVQSKKYRPSMNFGWLKPETEQLEYERVVLHEFGHALGLIHEHQNPENNPVKWNVDKTYFYYQQTQRWSKAEVDNNIFHKYSKDQLIGTSFDPKSIMLYSIPKYLTIDGYSTTPNSSLSEIDKNLIQLVYPKY